MTSGGNPTTSLVFPTGRQLAEISGCGLLLPAKTRESLEYTVRCVCRWNGVSMSATGREGLVSTKRPEGRGSRNMVSV